MVSDNSKDASVEVVKVTAVSSGENMVSHSVTGLCEGQVDIDHNPHSGIKQAQPTKINTEEMSSQSVENESSQELSAYLQTEDSDNDIESILDKNNETGSNVQTQLTVDGRRSKLFS